MNHSLSTATTDGPLMRWVLAYAKPYVADAVAKKFFDKDVGVFRNAREHGGQYWANEIDIYIDDVWGKLEFCQSQNAYAVNLHLGDAWLTDYYRDGHVPSPSLSVRRQMPMIIRDGFIGEPADKLVQLPSTLHSVIAGRKLLRADNQGEWTRYTLQGDDE